MTYLKTSESSSVGSFLMSIMLFLSSIVGGFFAMSKFQENPSLNRYIKPLSQKGSATLCSAFKTTRFCGPDVSMQFIHKSPGPTPDDDQGNHPVFGDLHWSGGSEADAAVFMTTVNIRTALNSKDHRRYLREDLIELITPVWRDYPTLVAASTCLYCGDVAGAITKIITKRDISPQWAHDVGRGISRYLPDIIEQHVLTDEEHLRIARIQAQLGNASTPQLATVIAEQLIEHDDMDHLAVWVTKGLNGGQAIAKSSQLEQLPMNIIIAAWRHGVSMGRDSPYLTEFLLLQGYRPALRWLVWLQDHSAIYLSDRYSSYSHRKYMFDAMIQEYTDFPVHSGSGLGNYYSKFWQDIHWDKATKKWRR